MKLHGKRFTFAVVGCLCFAPILVSQSTSSQVAGPTPSAATAPTAVPALIPYTAFAEGSDGKPLFSGAIGGEVSMTFLLFKDEAGGEPLWAESQRVAVDGTGHYKVQLGSGSLSGIPLTVFATGEARWLEVQVAGQKPQPRALLSSVPYAAKAADAATLGGLPASAFMLAGTPAAGAATSSSASPDASSNVTTTGGTNAYLPKFNGASTVINSQIYDNGTSVGIGDVPNPAAKLDVNGAMIMRGGMTVSRTGNATSSTGFPSYGFGFYSNAYNSSTKGSDNPHFLLQSEPTGNNTASTGATFNLLYANHGTAPAETGLSINPTGILHFAPGQTFPGTGTGNGTITGVTAGTGLSGGGSSGAVTLTNAGIVALTAGSGLKSSGGQSPTLTVDTTKIPTLTDSPTFTGSITANSSSNPAVSGNGTSGATGISGFSDTGYAGKFSSAGTGVTLYAANAASSNGFALSGLSSGTQGVGVYGEADGNGGYGVYGVATGAQGETAQIPIGVYGVAGNATAVEGDAGNEGIGVSGFSTTGYGVFGTSESGYGGNFTSESGTAGHFTLAGSPGDAIEAITTSTGHGVTSQSMGGIGVLGIAANDSTLGSNAFASGVTGGVIGDTSANGTTNVFGGIIGYADDNDAGYFANNSANSATIFALNQSSGGTGLFKTLQATSREGTCGIGSGSLSCTGQVKSLVSTDGGAHTVETYAMQSPENWMEDFGSGSMRNGVAIVSIDPAFAETANTASEYHIFLTPKGDSKGLYVVAETATKFEVHESSGGTSSLSFDYRIVAKRRGYETQRLKDVSEAFTAENGVDASHRELARTQQEKRGVRATPPPPAVHIHPGRGLQAGLRRPVTTLIPKRRAQTDR